MQFPQSLDFKKIIQMDQSINTMQIDESINTIQVDQYINDIQKQECQVNIKITYNVRHTYKKMTISH